jgi:hypothetical protein
MYMLEVCANDDPRIAGIKWVKVDPNDAVVAEPSDEDLKIFRARQTWLGR